MIQITLIGQPITKKNHQQIVTNRATGRAIVIQSVKYTQYEKKCLKQIVGGFKQNLVGRYNLCARYWLKDKRVPDLLNLLAATSDILEKGGVISNDKYFVSVDGSLIMGVDRENPRVEIEIKEVESGKSEQS